MPTIRLGTASPSTQETTAATIALLSTLATRAADQGIDLLLLPEAFIGGYPRGTAFGCIIGSRSEAGRDEYADYFDAAIDLGDVVGDGGAGAGDAWVKRELPVSAYDAAPAAAAAAAAAATGIPGEAAPKRGDGTREELERIARETGVFIVTGLIERAGGSLYCSAVYVCPKLGIIGKRRKVMPTATERLVWAQGGPATLRAVSTTIRGVRVNLAAAICWENYMPLLRQTLYAQNVNLYLAPTADARDAWLSLMRTVGVEGRCFVVSSNMCVPGKPVSSSTGANVRSGLSGSAIAEEEGDTISPSSTAAIPASPVRQKRRKSVFDNDGNEIVLSCPPEDDGSQGTQQKPNGATRTSSTTKTAAAPAASWISRGGSCIVNPFGDVLAGPQWEDPDGLIYADVNLRDCIRGRLDFDAGGSYSRNDTFKFSVNGLDLEPLPY